MDDTSLLTCSSATVVERIAENDTVMLTGAGLHKAVAVKRGATLRIGRAGTVQLHSLIGMRFGEVVQFNERTKKFEVSDSHPDLDRTELGASVDESKDNRFLEDTMGANQQLSHAEVTQLKQELGVQGLVDQLVESSSTFASKTAFAQEKYIRKKKVKYAVLFKVERVTPDNLAEMQIPTISPSDQPLPEDSRHIRLRCDTLALMLHHGDIHSSARVVCYDKTNGVLPAAILNRLGAGGKLYHVMNKVSHPNTVYARMMDLPLIKERWKAVPRNQPFLTGEEYERDEPESEANGRALIAPSPAAEITKEHRDDPSENEGGVSEASGAARAAAPESTTTKAPVPTSQWMRGKVAREELLDQPADSLVVADDDSPLDALREFFPFLSLGGHVVLYSSFFEHIADAFKMLRNDCVCIRMSETWYRYHQVLSNRTHPTVNMSTAGGFLLTAIKVERNSAPRPRYITLSLDDTQGRYNTGVSDDPCGAGSAVKRPREE